MHLLGPSYWNTAREGSSSTERCISRQHWDFLFRCATLSRTWAMLAKGSEKWEERAKQDSHTASVSEEHESSLVRPSPRALFILVWRPHCACFSYRIDCYIWREEKIRQNYNCRSADFNETATRTWIYCRRVRLHFFFSYFLFIMLPILTRQGNFLSSNLQLFIDCNFGFSKRNKLGYWC